jgi:hypothetical protein
VSPYPALGENVYIRYFRKREALTIWEWIQLVQRKQAVLWSHVKMAIFGLFLGPR